MDIMELGIYAAMLFFVLGSLCNLHGEGLLALRRAGRQLNKARKKKLNTPEQCEELRADLMVGVEPAPLFRQKALQYQWELFCADQQRLSYRAVRCCDVGDYLNDALLDEVGNRRLCAQVPSMLTALGILGTFFGLTQGLSAFGLEDTDQILTGISALLNGMDTAFRTSIVGIVGSLVYDWWYKSVCRGAQTALDRFVEHFRRSVLPPAEEEAVNELLNCQRQQLEALRGMDEAIRTAVRESLAEPVAGMQRTVEALADCAAEQQTEALQRVTDRFIEKMNASLRGRFAELRDTVRQANESCLACVEQMNALAGQMQTVADRLHAGEENAAVISGAMASTAERFRQIQTAFGEELDGLRQVYNTDGEILEQQVQAAGQLAEYGRQLTELSGRLTAQLDGVAAATDAAVQGSQSAVEDMGDAARQQIHAMMASTGDYAQFLQEQTRQLAEVASQCMRTLDRVDGGAANAALNDRLQQLLRAVEQTNQQCSRLAELMERKRFGWRG